MKSAKYSKTSKSISRRAIALTAVAAILTIGVISIIAIYPASRRSATSPAASASPSTVSPAASISPSTAAVTTSTPTPQQSDEQKIRTAIQTYDSASKNSEISNLQYSGNLAKGSATVPGSSGYMFIAEKTGGTWQIIFRGQELPPKSFGSEHNLPSGWFSTSY